MPVNAFVQGIPGTAPKCRFCMELECHCLELCCMSCDADQSMLCLSSFVLLHIICHGDIVCMHMHTIAMCHMQALFDQEHRQRCVTW